MGSGFELMFRLVYIGNVVIFLGRFELEIENQKFLSVDLSFCPSSICHPWLIISSI